MNKVIIVLYLEITCVNIGLAEARGRLVSELAANLDFESSYASIHTASAVPLVRLS